VFPLFAVCSGEELVSALTDIERRADHWVLIIPLLHAVVCSGVVGVTCSLQQ
jgi:hypothetical protein